MEKLGVELPLLITQIVNFTIMIVILSKLLYKPILKSLETRRKKIEEGLAYAQKAKDEEVKLEESRQKILSKARSEAKQIIDQAKKDSLKVKDEIVESGKAEVESLRAKLEKEFVNKEEEITAEITSNTVAIASEMVKRLIPTLVDKKGQHEIIVQELARIERKHDKK